MNVSARRNMTCLKRQRHFLFYLFFTGAIVTLVVWLQIYGLANWIYAKNVSQLLPSVLNIYNISKTGLEDPHRCIKTKTPEHFIICTYSIKEDKFVSGSLQTTGLWESSITYRIYRVLNQDKPITFIDVGANIGYYSLLAAATGQTVISVEPWLRHIHKLTRSIRLNKFQNNITVINNAVSNERRAVKIDTNRYGNLGSARLISDGENFVVKQFVSVKSILLDDLAPLIHTRYVVLKLDIEGHECRALERSEDIFNKFKIIMITMEWGLTKTLLHDRGFACQDESIKKMVDMLTRRGFVPFSYSSNKPLDVHYYNKWTDFDVYWAPIRGESLSSGK